MPDTVQRHFRTNTPAAEPRRTTWEGEEYLVVPVVAIVEGVLNGELVSAVEIQASVGSWNGRPVTLGHPEVDGQFVTANHPAVLAQYAVGQLFQADFEDGKLKGELWIDVGRALSHEHGTELLKRAQAASPIEVSTAYFRQLRTEPGSLDGEEYEGVAYDLKPDHLAILLHETGACSWRDGCGAPRVNEEVVDVKLNVLSKARTPDYSGTETASWGDVTKSFGAYRDGYYKHTGTDKPDDPPSQVADAPAAMRSWIAARTLLGESSADNLRDLIFFPVVNPSTNQLNKGALQAVLGGRGAQADIPEAAKESAQSRARALLEKEFDMEPSANTLQKAITKLGEMVGLALQPNEMSLDEQLRQVMDAFHGTYPSGEMVEFSYYVREVFEDRVIVERESARLWAYPYSRNEEGDIQFDEPYEVEMVYQPIGEAPASNAESEESEKEVNVNEKLVAQVAKKFDLEPAAIEEVAEEALQALVDYEPGPCAEYADLVEFVGNNGGAENALAILQSAEEAEQQQREKLIGELVANQACAFTQEELAEFSTQALQQLQKSLQPADYSGTPAQPQGEQVYELPKMAV